MPVDESRTEFTCVYIPCDGSRPMEERTVKIPKGETISSMIVYVKEHINETEILRRSGLSREQLRQERTKIGTQLGEQIKKNPQLSGVVLTDDIIDRVYLANAVDTVPLLPNCKATNFKSIVMYVDDQGMSKQLPRNARATTMCFAVGNQTEVLGDCFVAMIVDDNDDDFFRLDLTLKGLEDKNWMLMARGINTKKIPQMMPYLDVCRALQLTPEPSMLTKDKKVVDGENGEKSGEKNEENDEAGQNDESKVIISREITRAYSHGNKPLRDQSTVCASGHLNCEQKASLRCSGCKSIYYCTAAHQKEDWKRHKADCLAAKKKEQAAGN
jgi:hypothetical protein